MITMNHHPLHTNQWFAEQETQFGKNVVVGNLVYSLVLGMSVPDVSGSCIANLEVETLSHKRPTFHGDTIYAETRVLDKVESKSKEDRGIVTVETKAFNQRGEEVCYFRRRLMVWKTEHAPHARAAVQRRHLVVVSRIHEVAVEGFTKGTDAYERARPSYPPDAVAFVVAELGIGPVVDRRRPRRRHRQVHASARPHRGAAHRGRAGRGHAQRSWPRSCRASRCATAPPRPSPSTDESVDCVTVAQAFHWFRAAEALHGDRRVLRPGGGLALVWNSRDTSVPWVARLNQIIRWNQGQIPAVRRRARRTGRAWWPESACSRPCSSARSVTSRSSTSRCCSTGWHRPATSPPCPTTTAAGCSTRCASSSPRRSCPSTFALPHRTDLYWCTKQA